MQSSFRNSEGWRESLAITGQLLFLVKQQSTSYERKSLSVKSQISEELSARFPRAQHHSRGQAFQKASSHSELPQRPGLQWGWLGLPGDVSG